MAHEIQDVELEEEEYDEGADEDFNPDKPGENGDGSASSDDDDGETAAAPVKPSKGSKKRKADATDDLDSGDEATIQERKKKRSKKAVADDEESGGEGGLIKTRAQRQAEKVEKKQRKKAGEGVVTVDVDALWADLSNVAVGRPSEVLPKSADGKEGTDGEDKENAVDENDMITIVRRIEYAGQITEATERVPRSSKEAQRYLRDHPEADPANRSAQQESTALQRPLRRASIFEPNPAALVKGVAPEKLRPRAPSRLDVLMSDKRLEEEAKKKAEKMTTVQKSALDWRGWVEGQEGLREELDVYGKSSKGFLAREEFLGRADFAREVQARDARLKG